MIKYLGRGYLMIPVLLILLSFNLFAENTDTTISKIKDNITLIKSASKKFDIDYRILCSVIYTERTLNYNWEDKALDNVLAEVGLNSSIGFCQVKIKTAYWIEIQLSDTNSIYYCGKKYRHIIKVSLTPEEIITKLNNDSLNILYAAAYIKIMVNRWLKAGFPISNKPVIIGTLYSTGLFHIDGTERKPNLKPVPNEFGTKVKNSIVIF